MLATLRRTTHAQRIAALLLTILLLLVGTTLPGDLKADIEGRLWADWPWSASAHFVLFATMAAIPVYGEGGWAVVRAFALASLLAVITEMLQQHVPGRHPMVRDGLIDLAGTSAGLLARWAFTRMVR